jgi:hypothetical protein
MMAKSAGSIFGRVAACLLALVLAAVPVAWAKPTTPEQAGRLVANWLALESQPLGNLMGQGVKEVESYPGPDGLPQYYVVYLDLTGFVIVPADDLVEPIIGFVPEGTSFDPAQSNPLGSLVSSDVPGRVLHAREMEALSAATGDLAAPESSMAKAQRKWAWLSDSGAAQEDLEFAAATISEVRVAPFVQSRWSQTSVGGNACYNYYTPPNAVGSSSNYPCGCVATAMSQLLRYWQHPSVGVGSASFSIAVDGVPEDRSLRGGDGSGGAYDWANMVLVPGSYNVTQFSAIGALTHDAGVSVNMGYTASGSGADTLQAANAFTSVFKYSNARTAYNAGSNLPESNRNRMVNPNLHARYPVLFGITGSSGGHAIVCDGYGYEASTMYHHLNLGWAGASDAWYNLPDIGTAYYTFTSVYKCVYNVYVTGSGEIIAGRVTAADGSPISGANVTATRSTGGSYSATSDASGIYAIVKVPSNSSYTVSVDKTGYTFTPQAAATGASTNYSTATGNVSDLDFVGSVATITVSSFAVNNGGASTASSSVTLNNAVSASTPTHYMASESASFSGATWQAYSTAPSFTLSPGYGTKTVYFKVKNAVVESGVVSDAIELTAPPPGSLAVTINPPDAVTAGAQWRVDGGAWQASGATLSNLSAGQHTVSYLGISGWTTPANQTVTIIEGQTIYAGGTYGKQVQSTGDLTATISPPDAVTAGAQWRVDGGAWQSSGATLPGLSVGQHTVDFKGISGWTTPANQTVTIIEGQTIYAGGTYGKLAQPTGAVQVTIRPKAARLAGARWKVDTSTWKKSGQTISGLTAGTHTIRFKRTPGWKTPVKQTVTIAADRSRKVIATYSR